MSYKYKLFILIYWMAGILILIGYPFPPTISDQEGYYDKIAHMFLFGVLAFLLVWVLEEYKNINLRQKIIYALFLTIFYIILCEYYQNFVPGRTEDLIDTWFGIIGTSLGLLYSFFMFSDPLRPKLLLHICCIGCGAFVSQELRNKYNVTLFFYNSNIFPFSEFNKRLEEIKKVAKQLQLKVIIINYDHKKWRKLIFGHEKELEKGKRCVICYKDRLEQTAIFAKKNNFQFFASTLTVSPHKNSIIINQLGKKIGEKYKLFFLEKDFKKNNGFQKAVEITKKFNLYRQNYCGCEFSIKK